MVAVPVDADATIPNTENITVVVDILNTDISLLVVNLVVVVEVAKINLVIS